MSVMRAVRIAEFGKPSVCKLAQIDIPKPAAKQVLIRTEYAGINPVDTYIRSGVYARLPELPYTPGNDCAGIVHSVGADVKAFSPGDPVFTVRSLTGTCAEFNLAELQYIFPLHTDKLNFSQGASLGVPFFTAYRALVQRGKAKAGETVLIHGASGGVGTLCVQIAKHLGLCVLATAGSEQGLQTVEKCGADAIFNHKEEGYVKQIQDYTSSKGVNLIIEMLANVNLQTDLELLTHGGKVVVIGNRGNVEINPRLLMAKESCVMGCMLWATSEDEWCELRDAVAKAQAEGWLQPVVSKEYSLEETCQAHCDIIENTGANGNLVVKTAS